MPTQERFHSFDALRAAMMILGVGLHSATAYSTFPDVWWLKDPQTSRFADALLLFIHAFRLPVFFVMAGFFAALLWERRGGLAFIENRMMRLALPFLLGMLALFPYLKTASVWSWNAARGPDPWAKTLEFIQSGRLERSLQPMHLWFLEVLLWLCLGAVVAAPWLKRLESTWFRWAMTSWAAPLLFAIPTLVTLLPMEFGILDTPHSFTIHWRIQAAYAVFFAIGWGVYLNRTALHAMRRGGWVHIALAVLTTVLTILAIDRQMGARGVRDWPAFLTTAATTALTAWLMIIGLIGLFLRYAAKPSEGMRYLSDSAYWLYLFHPPVLVALQIPMMRMTMAPELKTVIGFVLAMPILLWTYDRWVRSTWLGLVLNGRRYPRYGAENAAAARLALRPAEEAAVAGGQSL